MGAGFWEVILNGGNLKNNLTTNNTIDRPSDRVRKKMENYVENFGNIMRKKVTITRKRRQIMRKFLKSYQELTPS